MTRRALQDPVAAALAAPAGHPLEVVVVGLHEAGQHYNYGLLVGQVRSLVMQRAATLRPGREGEGLHPVAEMLYDEEVLPVYDLAAVLTHLAPTKMGLVTTVRPYLLVVEGAPGQRYGLAVDEVAEIGLCDLRQLLPMPRWLRAQLHPPFVWAGVRHDQLIYGPARPHDGAASGLRPAEGGATLLLLLDCTALPGELVG